MMVSIDEVVTAGTQSITLNGSLSFAGLQIVISNADRPLLVLLYGMTTFILGGALAARVQRRFIPLSTDHHRLGYRWDFSEASDLWNPYFSSLLFCYVH